MFGQPFMAQKVLGQTDTSWWPASAREAVSAYDALMGRVPLIADDDARGEILLWVGRTDLPGSPAERYQAVSSALAAGAQPDAMLKGIVDQLKDVVAELSAKVGNAEEAYGTLSVADAAGSTPEAGMNGLCFTGSVALLGLVIAPLLLE